MCQRLSDAQILSRYFSRRGAYSAGIVLHFSLAVAFIRVWINNTPARNQKFSATLRIYSIFYIIVKSFGVGFMCIRNECSSFLVSRQSRRSTPAYVYRHNVSVLLALLKRKRWTRVLLFKRVMQQTTLVKASNPLAPHRIKLSFFHNRYYPFYRKHITLHHTIFLTFQGRLHT